MKKSVFILIVVLLTSSIVKSQNIENYYLPDFIDVENCASLLFYDETSVNISNYMARNHYSFYTTGWDAIMYNLEQRLDRAQPCYTDTLLTVKGIAIGVNNRYLLSSIDIPSLKKAMVVHESTYPDYYDGIPKGKLKLMNNIPIRWLK